MNRDFRAFRAIDFNWTHDLHSVWSDPATQLPKGIDNRIELHDTCLRPHELTRRHPGDELMAAKGGAAEDIARLTKGEFYFSIDGLNRVKVCTPLCQSWHPPNPPKADEVAQKGRSNRE
jgi:hypothetical protein